MLIEQLNLYRVLYLNSYEYDITDIQEHIEPIQSVVFKLE